MIFIYFYPRAVENSNIQVKHTIPLQNSELQKSHSVNRSITPVGNLAFLKQKSSSLVRFLRFYLLSLGFILFIFASEMPEEKPANAEKDDNGQAG